LSAPRDCLKNVLSAVDHLPHLQMLVIHEAFFDTALQQREARIEKPARVHKHNRIQIDRQSL